MSYWLMKSEPDTFSIDHLAAQRCATWDGVRNYQARNYIQQMRPGDLFLFHHSSCQPPGLAGIGAIVSAPYPDHSALDPQSPYFDPKASKERLPWLAIDVEFQEKFPALLNMQSLRQLADLEELALLKRASRLSVMPVTEQQWQIMLSAARQA